jgi:plasmid rolling circle replication initiator protein Rep
MRGRKSDSQFLSDFISQCVLSGEDTPEMIVNRAKNIISEIDDEIKRVEAQKIRRSKLLGVIETFEKANKTSKHDEAKILSFFKIQNQQVCKFICDHLKVGVVSINEISNHQHSAHDVLFCIKQLIEHKVVSKSGNHLLRGEAFDEYLTFVLRDT